MFLVLLTPFDPFWPFLTPYPLPQITLFTFLMLSQTNRSQHFENQMKIKRFRAYLVKLSRIHKFTNFRIFLEFRKFYKNICGTLIFCPILKILEPICRGEHQEGKKVKKKRNWERVGGSNRVKSTKKLCFWYFLPLLIPFDPPTPHPIPLFLSFWSFWCSSEQIGPNILKIEWKLSNWEHI